MLVLLGNLVSVFPQTSVNVSDLRVGFFEDAHAIPGVEILSIFHLTQIVITVGDLFVDIQLCTVIFSSQGVFEAQLPAVECLIVLVQMHSTQSCELESLEADNL